MTYFPYAEHIGTILAAHDRTVENAYVNCSCGASEKFSLSKGVSDREIASFFIHKKGWHRRKGHWKCPKCYKEKIK